MRILYLTPAFPYPPNSGGNIRSLYLLKALARYGEVTLLSQAIPEEDSKYIDEINVLCKEVILFDSRKNGDHLRLGRIAFWINRFKGLLKMEAGEIRNWYSREFEDLLFSLNPGQYDLIVLRYFYFAHYFLRNRAYRNLLKKLIIDVDDITLKFKRRKLRTIPPGHARVSYWINLFFLARHFKKFWNFSSCLAVSEIDRNYLLNESIAERVHVLPNVIEVESEGANSDSSTSSQVILFCGLLNYWPNEEGLSWFVEKVFPLIRRKVSKVQFIIVGKNPSSRIKALANEAGISVIGPVPSVKPFYERSVLVVVPILNGGGTRIKILEAMALKKPVVSTSFGCEGLDIIPGKNILVADSKEGFAKYCIELMEDEEKRQALISAGHDFVQSKHTIGVFYKRVNEILAAHESDGHKVTS